jgi:hypothetical protein
VKPRPVKVVWLDHFHASVGEWVDLDTFPVQRACEVVSYGWLVRKTKSTLVLSQSLTEGNQGTGVFVILRCCVTKVEYL